MDREFLLFLEQLALVVNFTNLKPDQFGACLIEMKETKMDLLFEFDHQLVPNTILVSTPIGGFPIDHRPMIYEEILKGNLDIEETLSVKPDEDLVFLHRRMHPDIQAADLEKLLEKFQTRAQEWQKILSDLNMLPIHRENSSPMIKTYPFKA